jgi:hypothetical protein
MTVNQFGKLVGKKGKYYINTPGHGMALVKGKLYDLAEGGFDKRRIGYVTEVMTKSEYDKFFKKYYQLED